jgi:hypothetical protein
MLDIFKKTHEDQPPEVKEVIAEPKIEPQLPQEPTIPVEPMEPPMTEESLPSTLQTLKEQETALMSQKTELVSIEEKLRLQTMQEIEKTKLRIENLRSEIPELKQKCEGLAKALEIPVYNAPAD